jgi:hypothetical protein
MESLIEALKQIEVERRWWSPQIFLNMENEALKGDVKGVFHIHNTFITIYRPFLLKIFTMAY